MSNQDTPDIEVPPIRGNETLAKRTIREHQPDIEGSQTIDGETGKPVGTPRRIDLSNLRDVRLELAYVYRLMDSGEIESQEGTRRAYVLKTIHDVIVSAELEKRLEALEQQTLPSRSGLPAPRLN